MGTEIQRKERDGRLGGRREEQVAQAAFVLVPRDGFGLLFAYDRTTLSAFTDMFVCLYPKRGTGCLGIMAPAAHPDLGPCVDNANP